MSERFGRRRNALCSCEKTVVTFVPGFGADSCRGWEMATVAFYARFTSQTTNFCGELPHVGTAATEGDWYALLASHPSR